MIRVVWMAFYMIQLTILVFHPDSLDHLLTYLHTYLHTYILTYILTYLHTYFLCVRVLCSLVITCRQRWKVWASSKLADSSSVNWNRTWGSRSRLSSKLVKHRNVQQHEFQQPEVGCVRRLSNVLSVLFIVRPSVELIGMSLWYVFTLLINNNDDDTPCSGIFESIQWRGLLFSGRSRSFFSSASQF